MDRLIAEASRALGAGDPLSALNRVALREDAPALALRGIAMAQLGDLVRARDLLRKAAGAFGAKEPVARARCVVAEAEIALVSRELAWPEATLVAARETLEAVGDRLNAAHARHLEIRRLLLIGRLDEAERLLEDVDPRPFPPAWRAAHELATAALTLRRLRTVPARTALEHARRAAQAAGIPALTAEVDRAARALEEPAARLIARGKVRTLRLEDVEALLASDALVVDACRHVVRRGDRIVPLTTRPVLFALAATATGPGLARRRISTATVAMLDRPMETTSCRRWPSAVSARGRLPRSNSDTPRLSSSRWTWRLTAAWLTPSSLAAWVKFRCRAAASKVTRLVVGGRAWRKRCIRSDYDGDDRL